MTDVKAVVEVKWLLAAFPGSVWENDRLYIETIGRVMPVPVTVIEPGDDDGPWYLEPDNLGTRYLIVDNLYNEMRVIGGIKKIEWASEVST